MEFFTWLFSTIPGMLTLCGIGIVFFLILAFILEKRTQRRFYNHAKSKKDDDSLFSGFLNRDDSDDDSAQDSEEADESGDVSQSISGMLKNFQDSLNDWDPDEDDADEETQETETDGKDDDK